MTPPAPDAEARTNPTPLMVLSLTLALAGIGILAFLLLSARRPSEGSAPTVDMSLLDTAGTVIDPPQPLTDFSFVANTGEPLRLSDLRGQYVLLYFGFTYCPDFCPTTMIKFKQIKALLGDSASQVAFVMISVDEARDTPTVLDAYMRRYDPAFIGLQGTDSGLAAIQQEYNLFYAQVPLQGSASGYTMDHSASKYLIDPQGQLIRIYSFTDTAAVVAEDILGLLATAAAE